MILKTINLEKAFTIRGYTLHLSALPAAAPRYKILFRKLGLMNGWIVRRGILFKILLRIGLTKKIVFFISLKSLSGMVLILSHPPEQWLILLKNIWGRKAVSIFLAIQLRFSIFFRSSLFIPVKVNMKHRSVHNSFMLLPIPNPSAEQTQPPVFYVSGTKPATRPGLLLSSGSSLGRANARTHQSGRHRLSLNSSSPLENGGLPLSGVYSLPGASLRDWLSGCSYDALPGTLTRTAHPQGFPQGTPSPKGTHPQTARLYPWLSLALQDSLSRKRQSGSVFSSWSGYPSAACSRYCASYAPGISGPENRENTPESSSLNLNYHLRLPEEAHSGLAASYLPQKSSSSRSFRARRGRYAKALSCLPQLCPRQPRRLLSYPCPAEEQGNA